MPYSNARRKKPILSAHQKQMRLFTGLSILIAFLFIFAIFWFLNRASFFSD